MTQPVRIFKEEKTKRSFVLERTKFFSRVAALGGVVLALLCAGASVVAQEDTLAKNQDLLLKARHSLMGQDVASAERFLGEATALNPVYDEGSDRPEYVEAVIQEYKLAVNAAQNNGMTESARRLLATSYLNQAEALRRCADFDGAEALVQEASRLDVTADATALQSGMDVASVAQRIRDDRLATETLSRSAGSEAAPEFLSEAAKQQVASVSAQVQQARILLKEGRLEDAEAIANRLASLNIPEGAFMDDNSPRHLLGEIAVVRSGVAVPAMGTSGDADAIRQVQAYEVTADSGKSNGILYVQEADAALRAGNNEAALANYRDAMRYGSELDAATVQRVSEAIVQLTNPATAAPMPTVGQSGIDLARAPQDIQNDVASFISNAYQLRKTEPQQALAQLKQLRSEVEVSALDASVKNHFLFSLDTAIADTNRFIDVNGPMIAQQNRNKDVEEQLRDQREEEVQIQNRLAEDTRLFEQYIEDGKYEEAEILAKKCQDYSHGSLVALQMVQRARVVKQVAFNDKIKADRENGWLGAMNDVESASVINVNDANPMAYGAQWERAKKRTAIDSGPARSEADMQILSKLDTRITLPFDRPMPLGTVLEYIADTMKINILQDERAFAEVGVTSDTPVETKLTDISLKNYLKHVLSPYDLVYVVRDEALTVTSKSHRGGEPVQRVYYVGDLIIDVPDFNSVNSPLSVQSAFDRSYKNGRPNSGASSSANTLPVMANNMYSGSMIAPNILAQIQAAGGNTPVSSGAAGGGNDPSELISLITSVIDPDSWDEVGQPQYFPEETEETEADDSIKVAVIGKPNVGKSSLINRILGEKRVIVSDVAGTTRDAVDTEFENEKGHYVFIDTAGIRRRSKVEESVEKFSVMRAQLAIDRADVCVIMIDGRDGVTEQDTKIAGLAHEAGKASIVVVNKWDLVDKETGTMEKMRKDVQRDLSFMSYAPIVFISAMTGQRVDRLFELINYVYDQTNMRITTGMLNDVLADAQARQQPPTDKGRRLKIYYMTQTGICPPNFVIFCNRKDLFHFSYQRYIENQIRAVFGLEGTPVRIVIRQKGEKEE